MMNITQIFIRNTRQLFLSHKMQQAILGKNDVRNTRRADVRTAIPDVNDQFVLGLVFGQMDLFAMGAGKAKRIVIGERRDNVVAVKAQGIAVNLQVLDAMLL